MNSTLRAQRDMAIPAFGLRFTKLRGLYQAQNTQSQKCRKMPRRQIVALGPDADFGQLSARKALLHRSSFCMVSL